MTKLSSFVIFDLYGTLVLTHENGRAWTAWNDYLVEYIRRAGGDAQAVCELSNDFWDLEQDTSSSNTTVFEYRLQTLLDRLSLNKTGDEVRHLADKLCGIWQDGLRFDPAVYDVLPRLGGRAGLVTNFDHPPNVRKLIKESGLDTHLGTVVVSGEEGVLKPDPKLLLIACRNIGCSPEHSIYVGDSIVDFEAAAAAGMRPVLIKRDGQETPWGRRGSSPPPFDIPEYIQEKKKSGELDIIKSLTDIPAYIGR